VQPTAANVDETPRRSSDIDRLSASEYRRQGDDEKDQDALRGHLTTSIIRLNSGIQLLSEGRSVAR